MTIKVKRTLHVLIAVVLVYVLICAGFLGLMMQTPDTFAGVMRHVPWPAFVVLPIVRRYAGKGPRYKYCRGIARNLLKAWPALWTFARRGSVKIGEVAPDFALETTDHKSRVQLSSLRGQMPVVLVFGSYT